MASTIMNATTPTEFPFFPKLPAELRRMVWKEALPNLNIQRFNAEITPIPDRPSGNSPEELVLCLTPHDDFIQLTKGYLGLLGACYESRAAAMENVDAYLPIHYVAWDQRGSPTVRFARVPFNPDGQVCISGLGPALYHASEGRGARGTKFLNQDPSLIIARRIRCITIPEIKNLTIALDPPGDCEGTHYAMFGWDFQAGPFSTLVTRMAKFKLETVELAHDAWLDERHDHSNRPLSYEWPHAPIPIVRPAEDDRNSRVTIQWAKALVDFRNNYKAFKAIKKTREYLGRGRTTKHLGGGRTTKHLGGGRTTTRLGGGRTTKHLGRGRTTKYLGRRRTTKY